MSIQDLLNVVGDYPIIIISFLGLLPAISFVYGKYIAGHDILSSPHRIVMSALVFMASVPGIFATTITLYSLLVLQENLLQVNMLLYFFPIVMMVLTLVTISRLVDLDYLPGFDRLKSLMILLFLTFVLTFLVMQTRIWLVFGGSIVSLIILLIGLFFLLRWLARVVLRKQISAK